MLKHKLLVIEKNGKRSKIWWETLDGSVFIMQGALAAMQNKRPIAIGKVVLNSEEISPVRILKSKVLYK